MAVTTAAIIGSVVALGSAGMSFAQAAQQKDAQSKAQAAADTAMADAKRKLDENFYASQSIKKEPYELASEALISQGAQAIEAAQEQERGAAATAGRVQMAMNEAQAANRTAMGKEMTDIENRKLAEDSRLRDIGVQINQEEAAGAQQAAADAARAAAAATAQGFASVTSAVQQGLQGADLYSKSSSAKQFEGLQKDYNSAIASGKQLAPMFYGADGKVLPLQQVLPKLGNNYGFDLSGVNAMNPFAVKDYFGQQKASDIQGIRSGISWYAPPTNPLLATPANNPLTLPQSNYTPDPYGINPVQYTPQPLQPIRPRRR